MFAKLFTTKDRGQLLVVRQTNADGEPEMRTYCEPEGLGVCSVALVWQDDDEGWDLQEACFGRCTEETAREMTDRIFRVAAEMLSGSEETEAT
jgi:hypothetical protein